MAEAWLPIEGYEGRYEVSSEGRIRSLRLGGGVLKSPPNSDGYPQISLRKNGKLRVVRVHRIVALTFHADKRNALHKEVAHLDGNRANPGAANLKWVSRGENISHKRRHGTHQAGEMHPRAKLTEAAAAEIRASRGLRGALAEKFGISKETVTDIRRGKRWQLHAKHASGGGAANRPNSGSNP